MDVQTLKALARLVRSQRVAALGTLHDGTPFVSMVAYAVTPDLDDFWLHLSRLALHTQSIRADPRVGLMIAEPDQPARDPQTLARVSIQGEAAAVARASPEYETARSLYLARFPGAETAFGLGDFDLYRIAPRRARFVAGFGQIYNLTLEDFREAGKIEPG